MSIYSKIELDLTVPENPDNRTDDEICVMFEDHLEDVIFNSAKTTLNENKDDIYGFGRRMIKFDRKAENAEELYRELLSDCKLNINIKCKIVNNSQWYFVIISQKFKKLFFKIPL